VITAVPPPDTGVDPGSIADWVAGIGGLLAFAAVAVTLILQLLDRRAQQASNFDYLLWVGDDDDKSVFQIGRRATCFEDLRLTLWNNSQNIINDVVLSAPFTGLQLIPIGKIPPGEHTALYRVVVDQLDGDWDVPTHQLIPMVQFRDHSGRVWQRTATGTLRHIKRSNRKWLLAIPRRRPQKALPPTV